ncbi:hypothetical protein [Mesorhizobium sp. 128a]
MRKDVTPAVVYDDVNVRQVADTNRSQAGIQIGAVVNMRDRPWRGSDVVLSTLDQALYVSAAGAGFARVRDGSHFCRKRTQLGVLRSLRNERGLN